VHAKRPLLNGARIKILDVVYTWNFPKADEPGTPDRPPPEKAANSSPTGKVSATQSLVQSWLLISLASPSVYISGSPTTSSIRQPSHCAQVSYCMPGSQIMCEEPDNP